MSDFKKRMMEDMQLHGYSQRTVGSYVSAVSVLSKHYQRSPDQLTENDLRKFFLHLINERKAARNTLKIYLFLRENPGPGMEVVRSAFAEKKQEAAYCVVAAGS